MSIVDGRSCSKSSTGGFLLRIDFNDSSVSKYNGGDEVGPRGHRMEGIADTNGGGSTDGTLMDEERTRNWKESVCYADEAECERTTICWVPSPTLLLASDVADSYFNRYLDLRHP